MRFRKKRPYGDFVYASQRKLNWLAAQSGISTRRSGHMSKVEGRAAVEAGVPSVAKVSAEGRRQETQAEVGAGERAVVELIEKVRRKLGTLPDLENGDLIQEGEWFQFHRPLKFGVGHSDAGPPLKALVVVDREPVPMESLAPGLLMNGSVAHVLDPYATEELRSAPGSRSGSGTERLFNWLEELRQELEAAPGIPMQAVLSQMEEAPRDARTALDMYGLFAREEWLKPYLAEPLMHGALCEGVAQGSFIAIGEEGTVVMGSPLYVRIAPLRQT